MTTPARNIMAGIGERLDRLEAEVAKLRTQPAPVPTPEPQPEPTPTPTPGFTRYDLLRIERAFRVSTDGDDSNDGVNAPVRTLARAYDLARDGHADRILIRAGDVFGESFPTWSKSGGAIDAPLVVGVYGDGPRPRFEVDNRFLYTHRDRPVSHVAFQGLHITRPGSNPAIAGDNIHTGTTYGVNWLAPGENVAFEDCRVEYFAFGLHFQLPLGSPLDGLALRRNITRFCWNSASSNSCGLKAKYVRNLSLIENTFDHNGWIAGQGDRRDEYCHNIYLTPRPHEEGGRDFRAKVIGNILARGASHGIKMHPGGDLIDNLFLGNAIAAVVNGADSNIARNVAMYADDLDPDDEGDKPRGWGIEATSLAKAKVWHNIFAYRRSAKNRGMALELEAEVLDEQFNIIHNWSADDELHRNVQINGKDVGQAAKYAPPPGYKYRDPNRELSPTLLQDAGERERGEWPETLTAEYNNAFIREGFEVVKRA